VWIGREERKERKQRGRDAYSSGGIDVAWDPPCVVVGELEKKNLPHRRLGLVDLMRQHCGTAVDLVGCRYKHG
jgi:hypothetical protein